MREHIIECLEQEKLSISKASICCGKQRLQDFWPLIELCRVWQGKKVQIVSKKRIFWSNFPPFSHTLWLKSVLDFHKSDQFYVEHRRLLMFSFILFCFTDLTFAFYFIFLLTHDKTTSRIFLLSCIWRRLDKNSWFLVLVKHFILLSIFESKNVSEEKPLLIRQNHWGIDNMILQRPLHQNEIFH